VEPLDPVLLTNYGRVLEESGGDLELVATLYERAVELLPNDVNSLCTLGCFQASRHIEADTGAGPGAVDGWKVGGEGGGGGDRSGGDRARERAIEGVESGSASAWVRGCGLPTASSSQSCSPPSPPAKASAPLSSAARHPCSRSLAPAYETFRRVLDMAPFHGNNSQKSDPTWLDMLNILGH
jgi:hypothetical protein